MNTYKIQLNQYEVDALCKVCGKTTTDIIECFDMYKGLSTIISTLYYKHHTTEDMITGIYSTKEPMNYYTYMSDVERVIEKSKLYFDEKYKNHQNKYVIEFTQEELNVLYSICTNITGDPVISARGICDYISYTLITNDLITQEYKFYGYIGFIGFEV